MWAVFLLAVFVTGKPLSWSVPIVDYAGLPHGRLQFTQGDEVGASVKQFMSNRGVAAWEEPRIVAIVQHFVQTHAPNADAVARVGAPPAVQLTVNVDVQLRVVVRQNDTPRGAVQRVMASLDAASTGSLADNLLPVAEGQLAALRASQAPEASVDVATSLQLHVGVGEKARQAVERFVERNGLDPGVVPELIERVHDGLLDQWGGPRPPDVHGLDLLKAISPLDPLCSDTARLRALHHGQFDSPSDMLGHGFPLLSIIAQLAQRQGDNAVIVDVGANKGLFAHAALHAFWGDEFSLRQWAAWASTGGQAHTRRHVFEPLGLRDTMDSPGPTVLMFEASPVSQAALHDFAAYMGFPPTATVVPKALHEREGVEEFWFMDEVGNEQGSFWREGVTDPRQAAAQATPVQVTTLDAAVAEHNITHIDLLKVDCEGSDAQVLRGGRVAFDHGIVDVVVFEYGHKWLRMDGSAEHTLYRTVRWLYDRGLHCFVTSFSFMDAHRTTTIPISGGHWRPEYENFGLKNVLCVRRNHPNFAWFPILLNRNGPACVE